MDGKRTIASHCQTSRLGLVLTFLCGTWMPSGRCNCQRQVRALYSSLNHVNVLNCGGFYQLNINRFQYQYMKPTVKPHKAEGRTHKRHGDARKPHFGLRHASKSGELADLCHPTMGVGPHTLRISVMVAGTYLFTRSRSHVPACSTSFHLAFVAYALCQKHVLDVNLGGCTSLWCRCPG
jgi:hypothetical protein